MLVERYDFRAKDGQEACLLDRLEALAHWLIGQDGCAKVEILAQIAEQGQLAFVEHWTDSESRQAAGMAMDRTILQGLMAASVSLEQHSFRQLYVAEPHPTQTSGLVRTAQ